MIDDVLNLILDMLTEIVKISSKKIEILRIFEIFTEIVKISNKMIEISPKIFEILT